jgi:large subunit ribosomal protein L29
MAKKATASKTTAVTAAADTAARKPVTGAFSQRQNKAAEKVRNLSDGELANQERDLNDQLFRLKFQLQMGQTESLKKIRSLRRELARVKSIRRGRQIGFEPAVEKR